jgi:hypothetical protein
MTDEELGDVEKYLLNNWVPVRQLERSLFRLRDIYQRLLMGVLDKVEERHPELVCRGMDLLMDEDVDNERNRINLGIGKESWPSETKKKYPTGLWLSWISLGELASFGSQPSAAVWIGPPKNYRDGLKNMEAKLKKASKVILKGHNVQPSICDKEQVSVSYRLPITSRELFNLLLERDKQPFIDELVSQFNLLAKFIPIVDEIFFESGRSRRAQ